MAKYIDADAFKNGYLSMKTLCPDFVEDRRRHNAKRG